MKWSEVKVAQSCPTLCNSMDYTVHGILQARILERRSFSILQDIFPTQASNPGLLHCRQILYIWATKKPKNTEVGTPSLLQGIFPTQEWTGGLLHCRQILYQLSYREERKGNGKLFFNVYKVSVMQNEYVLEICYTTVSTVNNMTSCIKTC